MNTPPTAECREITGLSPDPRVRVFRRTLHGLEDFEGMEVDAYVVLGASHVVVLDTLLNPADVAGMLAALGPALAVKQLLCVNSHADWDHVWGNGYFRHTRPAPLIAHERCRQRLLDPEALTRLERYQQETRAFDGVVVVPPTLTFTTQMTIADEELSIELLHAPGHCRDQIVAWLPALRLLLGFDAIEWPLPCIEESACAADMLPTLQRLAALNPLHVLCSHGNVASPAQIQENLTYFQEIERRARQLLATRLPATHELEQAATLINYPFDEAIAHVSPDIDRAYYSWAHEQNARAILTHLRPIIYPDCQI
jgi:glyoxylase-like metal-dependent hydrolase (beta-lactamase superfamily II)